MDTSSVWLVFSGAPPSFVCFVPESYLPTNCLTWGRTFETANECIVQSKRPEFQGAMPYEYKRHITGRWELIDDS